MAKKADHAVFFVGEGPSDIGEYVHPHQCRSTPVVEGFVPTVVRRLAEHEFRADGLKLATFGKKPVKKPADALGKKARLALELAGARGCCALVFCVDADKKPGEKRTPREAERRVEALRKQIEEGFSAAIADKPELASIHRVLAMPVRIIETWALADRDALPHPAEIPTRPPEQLWGEESDPTSSHPKVVLRRALGSPANSARLTELAAQCDLTALARVSPSFERLRGEVQRVVEACSA